MIMEIINQEKIFYILEKTKGAERERVEKIIEKAKSRSGLDLEEVGVLVNVDDEELVKKMQQVSREIKMAI